MISDHDREQIAGILERATETGDMGPFLAKLSPEKASDPELVFLGSLPPEAAKFVARSMLAFIPPGPTSLPEAAARVRERFESVLRALVRRGDADGLGRLFGVLLAFRDDGPCPRCGSRDCGDAHSLPERFETHLRETRP